MAPNPPEVAASMVSLNLNEDIIHLLLPFLRSRKTVLAMMLTCRSLYAAGKPWLLRLRYQLSTDNLQKCYAFLLEDAPRRFELLRDLDVLPGPEWNGNSDEDSKTIVDIIHRAVNLKVLRLYDFWARTFIPFPAGSLQHLEQLQLNNVSARSVERVLNQCPHCPLKRISIDIYMGTYWKYYGMTQLSKFSSTLECIDGGGEMCRENEPVQSNEIFPNVVSFRETHIPPSRVAILRAFPNLKILALRTRSDVFNRAGALWHDPNWQAHTARRMLNIASNIHNGRGDPLVYLDVDALSLYTLALECRVTYLVVRQLNLSQDRDFEWLQTSLESMRPTYLRFHSLIGRPVRFAEVLSHGTDGVRKLWMHLIITSKRRQYQEGLDSLIDALPHGLRVFECKISAAWAKGERRGTGGDTKLVHHPATQFLRELDVGALVQRALVAAPELIAVRVELLSGKTRVASRDYYWLSMTDAQGTTRSLRVISANDYKTASRIEEEVVAFLKKNHYGHL